MYQFVRCAGWVSCEMLWFSHVWVPMEVYGVDLGGAALLVENETDKAKSSPRSHASFAQVVFPVADAAVKTKISWFFIVRPFMNNHDYTKPFQKIYSHPFSNQAWSTCPFCVEWLDFYWILPWSEKITALIMPCAPFTLTHISPNMLKDLCYPHVGILALFAMSASKKAPQNFAR